MTDSYTLDHFERELKYWNEWTAHEQKAYDSCPKDTKPYIEVRLAMGLRNIKEITKALEVLKPNDMATSSDTVAASAEGVVKGEEVT